VPLIGVPQRCQRVYTLAGDDAVYVGRPTTTTTTTTTAAATTTTTTTKVNLSIYTPSNHIMGVEVLNHSFLTSALNGGEHSVSQSN